MTLIHVFFTTKPRFEVKKLPSLHKWIPMAEELKGTFTPKECKCDEFCLQTRLCIRAIPSYSKPQFQSEAKCKAIDMHSRANKTHFHKKGFALSLVLKGKLFGNRRWSIAKMQALFPFLVCLIRDLTRSRFGHLTANGKPRFAFGGFTLAVCPYLELKFSFISWSLF